MLLSTLNDVLEREGTILCILLIKHLLSVLQGGNGSILAEINKDGLNRLHIPFRHHTYEIAGLIAVHLDGRNGRFVDFLLIGVLSLTLIDNCIVSR